MHGLKQIVLASKLFMHKNEPGDAVCQLNVTQLHQMQKLPEADLSTLPLDPLLPLLSYSGN